MSINVRQRHWQALRQPLRRAPSVAVHPILADRMQAVVVPEPSTPATLLGLAGLPVMALWRRTGGCQRAD